MNSSKSAKRWVRFGLFEADLQGGGLRKHGLKIRLQSQPFEILRMLLERAGDVVTREELKQKLWPADSFVDFDHGLNNAINRLREALADSAENPHYIETLPKHGYRFTASVEVVSSPAAVAAKPRGLANKWLAAGALAGAAALVLALNPGHVRSRLLGRPDPSSIHSLAVLPLENLSGDAAQEYFAEGMTDELTGELAHIGTLKVISRTSAMSFKGSKKTTPEIARELGVDAVVEGGVLRAGDRVRISAQLIHGSTDRHLWAQTYERDLRDVLALQGEVARAIAQEIKVALTSEEQTRLASARPVDPEAYEAYLEGRYFYNKFAREGWRKSIEYFERAIAKDPTWALPYFGLADSDFTLGINNALPNKICEEAKAAALEALKKDDAAAEAHESLANIEFLCDWDWSSPEREFRRAIELSPSLGEAHGTYGLYLQAMGRTNEGLEETKRAVELDPLSIPVRWNRAHSLYLAGQYDAAAEQCRKMVEIDPNIASGHFNLGDVYVLMGNLADGIQELEKAVTLPGGWRIPRAVARLGYAYAVAGRRNDAQWVLDQLKELSKTVFVHPDLVAAIYAGLGQKQDAFAWLEKAYQVRGYDVVDLRYDPHFASLRSDPRFTDLVRRVGLPP